MSSLSSCLLSLALAGSLVFSTPAHAASDELGTARTPAAKDAAGSSRLAFSAAYLGELVFHPGALVGVEYRLAPAKRVAARGWELSFASNLGSYVHVRNHVGMLIDAELGARYGFRSGVFVDGFAGVGYLHTFLAAPVYEVDAAGHAERVTDLGRPAFMPVLSAGGGYQTRTLAGFLRFETFGQYPFNQHLLPHVAVLVGARISADGVSL